MLRLSLVGAFLVACGPSSGPEGQCKDTLVAGDLVITEVFADFRAAVGGTGVDDGREWFEIFNNSDRAVELQGLRIDHSRPDGSRLNSHLVDAVTLEPGQFFTLGNSAPDLLPPYVDYGYSADLGDFFNSDGGKLALACGATEIDSATYEAVREGRSRQLTGASFPDYTINDDPANWCEAADAEFEAANFGTPGTDNDCTPVVIGACNDNGTMRDSVLPNPGDLVITEVMPNPAAVADGEGEWFEAKATRDIDLNGVAMDRAGDTTNPTVIASPDCIRVTAGSSVVFAQNADMAMNGGLPAGSVRATFSFALIDGTMAAPGDVQLLVGTTVIDAITWTSTRSGRSHALDPDLTDPTANDAESNFCDGTVPYGLGDLGTPTADNTQCVLLPPAGMCDDGVAIRAIVKPAAGQLVITEFLANPAPPPVADGTTDADKEWFEIVNTGATSFDLNELSVTRIGNATPSVVASAACIPVAPNGFALFARSNDPVRNGMLPTVDATFDFSLVDSGVNRSIQVFDGVTELDSLTYSAAASAAQGRSMELDPDNFTTVANDLANPTAGVWCQGTTPYGDNTNQGTPKAANTQCP